MGSLRNQRDLKKLRIDANLFMSDYNRIAGGCGCSNRYVMKGGNGTKKLDFKSFLNMHLPNLRNSYRHYKLKGGVEVFPKAGENLNPEGSFNIFRDILSPNPMNSLTNQYALPDYKYSPYTLQPQQLSARSIF